MELKQLNPFRTIHPQFAPVCGIQMYEEMALKGLVPPYLLLLAHDILNPERYDRYRLLFGMLHREWANQGVRPTIILDNSVVELKTPMVDPDAIADAAMCVGANVIVLPDVYEDHQHTVRQCTEAYAPWSHVMDRDLGEDNYSFMYVPQGKTPETFAWCAEQLAGYEDNYPKIRWWGIPRNIVAHHGSREYGLNVCRIFNRNRLIHMLGFSDNFVDDFYVTWRYSSVIEGIDSAVPMRVGRNFALTDPVAPRDPAWLESGEFDQCAEHNLKFVQDMLR